MIIRKPSNSGSLRGRESRNGRADVMPVGARVRVLVIVGMVMHGTVLY